MTAERFASRIWTDVVFATIFYFFWRPVIRWLVLALALVFIWGMIDSRHQEDVAHGPTTARMSEEHIRHRLPISYSTSGNELRVQIENRSGATIGNVQIHCDDGDGRSTDVIIPDFADDQTTLYYSMTSVDISYSTMCIITSANTYRK
jgi:hypothetical protein